jgi:hypothetical protein
MSRAAGASLTLHMGSKKSLCGKTACWDVGLAPYDRFRMRQDGLEPSRVLVLHPIVSCYITVGRIALRYVSKQVDAT